MRILDFMSTVSLREYILFSAYDSPGVSSSLSTDIFALLSLYAIGVLGIPPIVLVFKMFEWLFNCGPAWEKCFRF